MVASIGGLWVCVSVLCATMCWVMLQRKTVVLDKSRRATGVGGGGVPPDARRTGGGRGVRRECTHATRRAFFGAHSW